VGHRIALDVRTVENCDIVDSSGFGFFFIAEGDEGTAVIDFGGSELGSKGHNRIINSALGDMQVTNGKVVARHNWWGGERPVYNLLGDSSIEIDPMLKDDPRPEYGSIRF